MSTSGPTIAPDHPTTAPDRPKNAPKCPLNAPECQLNAPLRCPAPAYSPAPTKRAKHDPCLSPSPAKDKQADWLQLLSASANKELKQLQFKQRPSAFRPWSPRNATADKDTHSLHHRLSCKDPEHPAGPQTPEKEHQVSPADAKHVTPPSPQPSPPRAAGDHFSSPQKCPPHGEAIAPAPKPAPPSPPPPSDHSETDGEIEVDNCDEGPRPSSFPALPPSLPCSTGLVASVSGAGCGEDPERLSGQPVTSDLEALRETLGGDLSSREARERFLQDVLRMRLKQEEKLSAALQAKRSLQQELEFVRVTKKGRLREALEAKRGLRKEIERLRAESERRVREASDACGRLQRELERERQARACGQDCQATGLRARYSTQMEELQVALARAEEDREQLRCELRREREARQNLERLVRDLQNQLGPKHNGTGPHMPHTTHSLKEQREKTDIS
ncbi:hypothetical protein ACEWY4_013448 [Coilia grayii]|uniref:Ski oncogene n=1 Tax=Coilia grayii TaxID=363190 RepID=A0ABD1JWF9_9TELE